MPKCQICKQKVEEIWNRNIGGLVADRCHDCSEKAIREHEAKGPLRGKL